ncbi:MAG: CapA family protein [Spirochaetota bacterium]
MHAKKLLGFLFFLVAFSSCASIFQKKPKIQVSTVNFAVVGDIMVHSTQLRSAYSSKCSCYNFEPVFAEVKPYLQQADLAIGNLETTLPGKKKLYAGYPLFGAPDSLAVALQKSGFNLLTTSNNHSCDTGKLGLENTIQTLDSLAIPHIGTYREKEYEQKRIFILEKNGIKIAFLSYTYGTNGIRVPKGYRVNLIDKKTIQEDIRRAKKKSVDAVAVYYHYGPEYKRLPSKFQKEIVDFAVNEGADIVLGGHPHVLQPYTLKTVQDKKGNTRDVIIAYSLGNFVSAQHRRYRDGGIIFNFTLTKKVVTSSASSNTKITIQAPTYVPVWVYRRYDRSGAHYHILPVEKYLKNDQSIKLTKRAYRSMNIFYKDTQTHLQKYSVVAKEESSLSQR